MSEVKINIDAYYKKVVAALEQFLHKILLKIISDADKIIRENKAVASGEMVRNLRETVYQEAGKIIGVAGVGKNVPYGVFRHEGTKPHFPPVDAIKSWVIKKGLVGGKATERSLKRTKKGVAADQLAGHIAFLIARKISKKGTTGIPFMKMALEQNRNYILSQLKLVKI